MIEIVNGKLDQICPVDEVRISQLDGKINSLALQKLTRLKQREYTKHGCSAKYKDLKKKVKHRVKKEGEKAISNMLENAKGKGSRWIQEANRLGARPGEDTSPTFALPSHVDSNFTPLQSAEAIAEYFSKISQEYCPIEEDRSSPWMEVQERLAKETCHHPLIEEHMVYHNMKSSKKTDSVPGDIPADILKEFLPEFTTPITAIIKEAIETHTWLNIFKKEFHLPLKKVPMPQSEDDLRGIGLTNWISKQLERVVLNWIWPFIRPHIDPDQMGGVPGCSIEHYIVKMLHFILTSMDGNPKTAVLAVPIDYSKAFNRMSHSDILCNLSELNVPPCATKLIQSYLTGRAMCVRYKGVASTFKRCPGSGPQGGLLTGVLFILQINKAGKPCSIQPSPRQEETLCPATEGIQQDEDPSLRQEGTIPPVTEELQQQQDPSLRQEIALPPVTEGLQQGEHPTLRQEVALPAAIEELQQEQDPSMRQEPAIPPVTKGLQQEEDSPLPQTRAAYGPDRNPSTRQEGDVLPPCHNKNSLHKKAYIDDLTLLEKISLSKLIPKTRIIGPPNFHDRFHLKLPKEDSILQHQLEDLKIFTKSHSMKINSSKTKCLPFINSRTKDFMPELTLEEGSYLEVIYQLKLVGLVINSELSWQPHVDYTVARVNKVIWQLVRLKQLGAPRDKLITLYVLKVRSILMFGAICFHSSLTQAQSHKIELQQKRCLAVILGTDYKQYSSALIITGLPRLDKLREKACLKWSLKAQSNPSHTHMFPLNQNETTRHSTKFLEQFCRGAKLYNSAIPSMIRELNKYYKENNNLVVITTKTGQKISV